MQSNNTTTETPKFTLKGSVQIEKEITLPYFCKYGDNHFIKVLGKDSVIAVHTYDFSTLIEIGMCPSVEIISKSVEITEEEFNAAKELVKAKINAL